MPLTQSEHERALAQHDRAYAAMESMRTLHGRESPQYAQARRDVVDAAREVRSVARRGQRTVCPTCGQFRKGTRRA